jgi:hypothetical protein
MATLFTGPQYCAECGGEFTRDVMVSRGSEPATVSIRGHAVMIPCLWRCAACDKAVKAGQRESLVTVQSARDYLAKFAGPAMAGALMDASSEGEFAAIMARLVDVIEVQEVLEVVIRLQEEPGGLDFIPECDHGHHCSREADPFAKRRQMAPMN